MTRHDLDLFSLLSGLVLIGIALGALFDVGFGLGPWVWPTILIALGLVVLTSVLRSSSRQDATAEDGAVDDLPDHHRDDRVLAEARAEVEAHEQGAPLRDDPAEDGADRPT